MSEPSKNQTLLVELSYKRSTDRLQTQATIANAADQRSLVFSTLSTASAALVFGVLERADATYFAVGAAIFFCMAAASSALSAIPGKVYTAGSKSSEIRKAIDDDTNYVSALLGLCENNDEYIDHNERVASRRAHLYRFAVILFLIGVAISLLGFHSLKTGGNH